MRKLRSGRWQALYFHPDTRERVPGPTTYLTKADATRWLATVEADFHRGDDLDPASGSQRFGPYAETWLAAKTNIRPNTQELYSYLLEKHILPTFGDELVAKIGASKVRVWNSALRSGSISEVTAAKAYRLLRQILEAAVDDRLIRSNPCRIKGAAVERSAERKIPSLDEVLRLADAIEPRYRAMVLLAAFAGLRKGECYGLARRHLDLDAQPPTVTVERARVETADGLLFQPPKTVAGNRSVALPSSVVDELTLHLETFVDANEDALVFTADHSGDTPTKTVWRRSWRKARNKAEVSCSFHDLRHVAGTLNAAAGATIKEAMARLGHSSPDAALRYQHALEERDSEIADLVQGLLDGTPKTTTG